MLELLTENGYVAGEHFSGEWLDLSNVPSWANVAFSGSYDDLVDVPEFMSDGDDDSLGSSRVVRAGSFDGLALSQQLVIIRPPGT